MSLLKQRTDKTSIARCVKTGHPFPTLSNTVTFNKLLREIAWTMSISSDEAIGILDIWQKGVGGVVSTYQKEQ